MDWKNIVAGAIIVTAVCWAYKSFRKPRVETTQSNSQQVTTLVDAQVQPLYQTPQAPIYPVSPQSVQPLYQAPQPSEIPTSYPVQQTSVQPIYQIPNQK